MLEQYPRLGESQITGVRADYEEGLPGRVRMCANKVVAGVR
jgi:hypothetical protein